MDSDILKFHAIFYVQGQKVRLTAELITGQPQQLDIQAVFLSSQMIYRGFMTDQMCDVATVLQMLRMMQASLSLVQEGLLLRCSPIKILLTPSDDQLDFKDIRIQILENTLEQQAEMIRQLNQRLQVLEGKPPEPSKQELPYRHTDSRNQMLTNHVWPKSRMMLAVVSRMLKEGLLNTYQRGMLKDMILDEDLRLVEVLQQYEMDGDRRKLYSSFLRLVAN